MSKYSAEASSAQIGIIIAAIGALQVLLEPYRNDQVITKKLFGVFSISITWGELLDVLVANFGQKPTDAPPAV